MKNTAIRKDSEKLYDQIIENLRLMLKERRIKQEELAGKLGITQSALSSLLRRRNTINLHQLLSILDMSGISFYELFQKAQSKAINEIKLTNENEEKLYSNPTAYTLRSILNIPMTLDEIKTRTGWNSQDIQKALSFLNGMKLIVRDEKGYYRQSDKGAYLLVSPDNRVEFNEMVWNIIKKKAVPFLVDEKKKGTDPNKEPLKYKQCFSQFAYLNEKQLAEVSAKIESAFNDFIKFARENKFSQFPGTGYRFTMFTSTVFDF